MSIVNILSHYTNIYFLPAILFWSLTLSAQQGEILTETHLPKLPATALEVIDETVYCGTLNGGFYMIKSKTDIQYINALEYQDLFHHIIDFTPYQDKVAITFQSGSTPEVYLFDPDIREFDLIMNSDSISLNSQGVDYGHAFPRAMDSNDSTIFIGTSAGLITYRDSRNTQYTCLTHSPQLPDCWEKIYDVKTIGEKAWLGLNDKIALYHPDFIQGNPGFVPHSLHSNSTNNNTRVNTIAPVSEDVVYLTTSSNLFMRFDHGHFDTVDTGSPTIEYRFVRETQWHDGTLWMVSGEGLFIYDGQNTSQVVPLESGRSLDVTECIKVAGGQSEVWYASCLVDNERPIPDHSDFVLSPNPADQMIRLEMNASFRTPLQFSLTDLSGRVLYTRTLEPGKDSWSIPLHGFHSGYYFGIVRNQIEQMMHSESIIITR